MKNVSILKLGGSVITHKKGGMPIVRTKRVREIAQELKQAGFGHKKTPRKPLILLYGGGSFGHPLAKRYKLQNGKLSHKTIARMGQTILAMRVLGNKIAEICIDAELPVVPLQTSSFAEVCNGKLKITDYEVIENILSHGGIPLFGGDVVIADHIKTIIASADQLAIECAQKFQSKKIFFATDVDGVYEKSPPKRNERPYAALTRKELKKHLTKKQATEETADVTGAMTGKLRTLTSLTRCTVHIFNGLTAGNLVCILQGKKEGTRITL